MPHDRALSEDRPLEGKSILVAEDEAKLRAIVVMMIEDLGARAVAVGDCESALAEYRERHPRFDAVLIDVRMRGMGGAKLFEELVRLDPGVRIVMSSGIPPDDDLLARLERHGGRFLEKPFDIQRLGDVLQAIIEPGDRESATSGP